MDNQAMVRTYLRENGLRVGDRLPGERAIAEAVGLGRAALRTVLDDLEAEGVLLRRPQSGTFLTAIPLPAVRCAHICVIAPLQDLGQPGRSSEPAWIHRVISSIERTVAPVGAKLTIIDQSPFADDPCAIVDLVRQAKDHCASAIVLLHALGSRAKIAHALAVAADLGAHPIVVSSRTYCGLGSQVYFDSSWGCYFGTKHLLSRGHARVGFAGAARGHEWVDDRLRGYRAALDAVELDARPEWVHLGEDGERPASAGDGADALRHWMTLDEALRPTGIVAASDTVALGLLDAARDLGLRCPADFSLIGFDNDPGALLAGLTTIERPTEALGEAVARVTLERIAAGCEAETVTVRLRPILIERRTVGSPPGSPDTAAC